MPLDLNSDEDEDFIFESPQRRKKNNTNRTSSSKKEKKKKKQKNKQKQKQKDDETKKKRKLKQKKRKRSILDDGDTNNTNNTYNLDSSTSTNNKLGHLLPSNLKSPSQLKWHKQHIPGSATPIYYPCRIIIDDDNDDDDDDDDDDGDKEKKISKKRNQNTSLHHYNLSSDSSDDNDDSSDDGNEEVKIEYISNALKHKDKQKHKHKHKYKYKYKLIPKKRLIPYHGQITNENDMDYCDISSSVWCTQIYNLYKIQQRQQQQKKKKKKFSSSSSSSSSSPRNRHRMTLHPIPNEEGEEERIDLIELSFLNDILHVTKQRGGYNHAQVYNIDDDNNSNDDDSSETSDDIAISNNHYHQNKKKSNNHDDDDERIDDERIDNELLLEPFDELEEPYTQAIDYKAMGYNSSDEEMEELYHDFRKRKKAKSSSYTSTIDNNNTNSISSSSSFHSPSKKSSSNNDYNCNYNTNSPNSSNKEPIRPGDVIEYYNPIFVFGDERGKRRATVISVDPKNQNSILKLCNDECLPIDTKVRRIKTLIEDHTGGNGTRKNGTGSRFTATSISSRHTQNGNGQRISRRLIDHPGILREIQEFRLVKLNAIKGYKIETERDRVRNILQSNMNKFRKKVEASGFAPMDMMNSFGTTSTSSTTATTAKDRDYIRSNTKGNSRRIEKNDDNIKILKKRRHDHSYSSSDSESESSYDHDHDNVAAQREKIRKGQTQSSSSPIKQKVIRKGSQTTPPTSTPFQRKVTETDSSPSPPRKVKTRHDVKHKKVTPYDNDSSSSSSSSSDDDEILRKLNNRYKMKARESRISQLATKTKGSKHKQTLAGNRGNLSYLSLRDTDDEEDDDGIIFNTAKSSRQLRGQAKESSYAGGRLNSMKRAIYGSGDEDSDKEVKKDSCLSLGLSSDSDDDELDLASFPKERKQKVQNQGGDECLRQSISPSTPIKGIKKSSKQESIKSRSNDSMATFDFQSSESDSDESISSSSECKISRKKVGTRVTSTSIDDSTKSCGARSESSLKLTRNGRGCHKSKVSFRGNLSPAFDTTKYRRNLKSPNRIRRKDSSPNPIRIDESRLRLNRGRNEHKNPTIQPLKFKVLKYN